MKKIYSSKLKTKGNLIALIVGSLFLFLVCGTCSSCKAWRTVTTTATCVQQNDTTKVTTTISTKTVEEYQGIKK